MILSHLNYLAVAVSAIVYFALGGMWYSPMLFVKPWAAANNVPMPTTDEEKKKARAQMPMYMITTLIMCFVLVIGIAYLETAMFTRGWMTGLKVGIIAAGIASIALGFNHMYTRKPLKVFIIDASYHTLGLVIAALILSVWK